MSETNWLGEPVAEQKQLEPQPKTEEKSAEKRDIQTVEANDRGLLIGSNIEQQYRLAKYYHASKLMPKGLDTPEKVLVAVQVCRELNLPPMTSISKVAVINGTPSIFGDLPLALVMRSGLLESFQETWSHDPGTHSVSGARCECKRKGIPTSTVREFTVTDAKKAGLWGKSGPWTLYPSRMLQMRARSWCLKDLFADVLLGIAIAEYDMNAIIDNSGNVVQGAPEKTSSMAEELNGKYLTQEETPQEQGGAA